MPIDLSSKFPNFLYSDKHGMDGWTYGPKDRRTDSLIEMPVALKNNEKVNFMTFTFKTMGKIEGEIMDGASLSYWTFFCL